MKKLVYVAHPISGDTRIEVAENLLSASKWIRWMALNDFVPVAPYFAMLEALDDNDPREREVGMEVSRALIPKCDELWLCGSHISEGMRREKEWAIKHDVLVFELTEFDIEKFHAMQRMAVKRAK